MGTPHVNRQQLTVDLTKILSRPEYAAMLQAERVNNSHRARRLRLRDDLTRNRTLYATGVPVPRMRIDQGPSTPAEFAAAAVDEALGDLQKPRLLHPIEATEIVGKSDTVYLYRAYDGNVAGTLGRWWCDEGLLKQIVASVGDLSAPGAHAKVIETMKTAMFVHPAWNLGTEIARLEVVAGARVPAIVGLGSWKAMKSPGSKDGKHAAIRTAGDLIDRYGMMPIPGPQQTFVPFPPGMRVCKVLQTSPKWPFA